MRLILYSLDDLAGCNISKALVGGCGFKETGGTHDGMPTYGKGDVVLAASKKNVKDIDSVQFKPEVCVVASRHKSESGKPTLTCHPTGNFGGADLGGLPGRLQLTNSLYLRQSLILLNEAKGKYGLPHEVSMEVTHHGPTELPFPLLYIEVGSAEEQWRDMRTCQAVAGVIDELMFAQVEDKSSAIGFGGPHYAPNFNLVAKDYAVGHIMPKYAAEHITREMVKEMVAKTTPEPQTAIVDWKGLRGAEKDMLQGILDKLGMRWVKTSGLK